MYVYSSDIDYIHDIGMPWLPIHRIMFCFNKFTFFVNVFLKCDWLIFFFFFKLVIPFKTLTWDTFPLFILHESKLSSFFFFSWDQ